MSIGAGHQIRCLAIAQELVGRRAMPLFVGIGTLPFIESRLAKEKIRLEKISSPAGSMEDAATTISTAKQVGAQWIILDGYSFSDDYHEKLKRAGLSLLAIDDLGLLQFKFADVVVNSAISSSPSLYPACNPKTRLLLGPEYALLRREFQQYAPSERKESREVKKIVISLGGSCDPKILGSMLGILGDKMFSKIEVSILHGATNPLNISESLMLNNVKFIPDNQNFAAEIFSADLAIASGGGTLWELSLLGIPTLCVVTAENQLTNVAQLLEKKAIRVLEPSSYFNPTSFKKMLADLVSKKDERDTLSNNFKNIVDGKGAYRVANILQE